MFCGHFFFSGCVGRYITVRLGLCVSGCIAKILYNSVLFACNMVESHESREMRVLSQVVAIVLRICQVRVLRKKWFVICTYRDEFASIKICTASSLHQNYNSSWAFGRRQTDQVDAESVHARKIVSERFGVHGITLYFLKG